MGAERAKVRFITRKWPPAVGGMETYSRRLTQSLADHVDLEVIALPGRPSGAAPNAASLAGFVVRAAARLALSRKADITHIGDMALWPLGWLAQLLGRHAKLVLSAHGRDVSLARELGWRGSAYLAYLRLGARLLGHARVVANSRYIAELAERAGFNSTTIIALGTDLARPDSSSRRDILFAGRITRAKGLRFLVEEVLPQLPDAVCLRVAGTVWEESERPLLADPRVKYLGSLSQEHLAAEFARARAVLIPSRDSEGFGLIAIEAAACGAYVIASDHSGLSEVVSPAIGELLDACRPEAWAAAIRSALEMADDEYRRHSDRARAFVEANYRWPLAARATLAVYDLA